jgi:heme exporter protein CcmD
MIEFLTMDGDGGFVWSAYGITLAVLLWNVWAAHARLKRNLGAAAREDRATEPAKRPTVRQL